LVVAKLHMSVWMGSSTNGAERERERERERACARVCAREKERTRERGSERERQRKREREQSANWAVHQHTKKKKKKKKNYHLNGSFHIRMSHDTHMNVSYVCSIYPRLERLSPSSLRCPGVLVSVRGRGHEGSCMLCLSNNLGKLSPCTRRLFKDCGKKKERKNKNDNFRKLT